MEKGATYNYCKIYNKSVSQVDSKYRSVRIMDLGEKGPDFIVTIQIGLRTYKDEVISREFVRTNVRPSYGDSKRGNAYMLISEAKIRKYIQEKYAPKQLTLF